MLLPRVPGLAAENASLRAELTTRQLEVAQLRESLRKLDRAGELAAAWQAPAGRVVSVIGRTTIATQHLILLDAGSREGLAPQTVVIDAVGVVGRVTDVYPRTSLAMLVTDPDSRIACLIERSRETGLLVGTGAARCRILYLNLDADVQVGDQVVTAGLGGGFPKGLALGRIVQIDKQERHAQSIAWVTPAAQLSRLEQVLCVPESPPSSSP